MQSLVASVGQIGEARLLAMVALILPTGPLTKQETQQKIMKWLPKSHVKTTQLRRLKWLRHASLHLQPD